jgi:Zn-dependent M28 family amino/carboxypeptidase
VQSNNEFQAVNIQGKLNGALNTNDMNAANLNDIVMNQANKKIPTIIITAHYDSFGLATVIDY